MKYACIYITLFIEPNLLFLFIPVKVNFVESNQLESESSAHFSSKHTKIGE